MSTVVKAGCTSFAVGDVNGRTGCSKLQPFRTTVVVTAGSAILQQGMLCKMVCCIKRQLPGHVPAHSPADGPT